MVFSAARSGSPDGMKIITWSAEYTHCNSGGSGVEINGSRLHLRRELSQRFVIVSDIERLDSADGEGLARRRT